MLSSPDANGKPSSQIGEVQTACGFQSASSPWLFFGLGDQNSFSKLEVFWPSGAREQLPAGRGDRRLTVVEGKGIVAEEQLP